MNEKITEELKNFCRLNDEMEHVRNRIKKIVSDILETEINYLKFECQVMPELVSLVGDEKPSCVCVKVSIQDSQIEFNSLKEIKEATGAANIYIKSTFEENPLSLNDYSNMTLELEILIRLQPPF